MDPIASVQTGDRAKGFAHGGGDLCGVAGLGMGETTADVAAAAAREGFLLVAEVAQDCVVATGAALAPAHQFQKEIPLVLDHRLLKGIAFDQAAAQRHVTGGDQ